MTYTVKKEKIIVISGDINTASIVKEAIGDSLEVLYISDTEKAMLPAHKERPLMIVMGYIEPQGSTFQLYSRLKNGMDYQKYPRFNHRNGIPARLKCGRKPKGGCQ